MLTIRRAGATDVDRLIAMHREFCRADAHHFNEGAARRALRPLLADDLLGMVWMAEGDAGGGYAVVTWGWSVESGGRDALLDEIYAEPRDAGIGSGLLVAVLAALEERGDVSRIFLETEAQNVAARRLYARHGFVVEPSVWMSRPL